MVSIRSDGVLITDLAKGLCATHLRQEMLDFLA
jgi:hypothetical protein